MSGLEAFGASLKRQRELRGISLEEVAQATRIHPKYIQALEEEHFEKLPGLTFLRGYVRAYAGFVGLDTEEMMLRLDPLIAQMSDASPHVATPRKRIYILILGLISLVLGVFLIVRSCLK